MVYAWERNNRRRHIKDACPTYAELVLLDTNETLFSVKGIWSAQALLALRSKAYGLQRTLNYR
jgi:hypothetical protein